MSPEQEQAVEERTRTFDYHDDRLDTIWEEYRYLHEQCPVGRSAELGGFAFLAKLDDIFAAEQDTDTYSVAPSMLLPSFGIDEPLIPIDVDPPAHTAYRRILLPLFTPARITELTPGMKDTARSLSAAILETARTTGTADLATALCRPFPTIVFSRLCGFPEEDWPKFDGWIDDIVYRRVHDFAAAQAAGAELRAYLDDLITKKRGAPPAEDLITILLNAQVMERSLTHDELISYGYLLFLAGLDTAAWSIRAGLWYLARNPEAQAQLRADRSLIPGACEEFLRTMSPVQGMARTCKKDTVVRGKEIKAGERVVLLFGAGNRDPEAFEAPDELRFDRAKNRHLAFGGGIHRCLGSNLGRRELVVAIEEFLDVVPTFRAVKPDTEPWYGIGPLTIEVVA